MKLLLALCAVFAATTAVPLDPWANPWQQNQWQPNPWQNPWQQPVKHIAIQHHAPQHIEAHFIPQQPPIPPPHPSPLKLKAHSQYNPIHYKYPHVQHPHLVGYEVAVKEPEIKHVIKPVHHQSW